MGPLLFLQPQRTLQERRGCEIAQAVFGQQSWVPSVPSRNGNTQQSHAQLTPCSPPGDRRALQGGIEEGELCSLTWCPRNWGILLLWTEFRTMYDCTGRGKAPGLFLFSSLIASAEMLRPLKRSKMSGFATATAFPQKADGWQGSKPFPKTKIKGDILGAIYFFTTTWQEFHSSSQKALLLLKIQLLSPHGKTLNTWYFLVKRHDGLL